MDNLITGDLKNIEHLFKLEHFEFYHHDGLSWPEVVVEVITFGQALGRGWLLSGDINSQPEGVLATAAGSTSSIPGLMWAHWEIRRENQA